LDFTAVFTFPAFVANVKTMFGRPTPNGTVGLQFHEWEVCEGAAALGEKLGLPVYRMLREPIISRYGAEFYDALQEVEKLLTSE